MKKSAKPETKPAAKTTKTVAKAAAAPTAVTGTLSYGKDTKRFHSYNIVGEGFNGTIYISKETKDIPKTFTLTIKS